MKGKVKSMDDYSNKRALSWNQFVESGFDDSDYDFPDFEGTFTATIACKRWHKHSNLLAYLDLDDGRKVLSSAWSENNYYGLADIPIGSKIKVKFVRSKSGKCYIRSVEKS
mgnify:CR=1 FL=1